VITSTVNSGGLLLPDITRGYITVGKSAIFNISFYIMVRLSNASNRLRAGWLGSSEPSGRVYGEYLPNVRVGAHYPSSRAGLPLTGVRE